MSERYSNKGASENIVAKGKIFELVQTTQADGRVFEKVRRAPGVRVIIANKAEQKILLTKEFRQELGNWDYRLPGGKVYDALDEYEVARENNEDIMEAVARKTVAEAREEAGVVVDDVEFIQKSILGATVEWDLYVMEATKWRMADGQVLEQGEQISADEWFTYEQAARMVLEGEMQEERIALTLLQWLHAQKPN